MKTERHENIYAELMDFIGSHIHNGAHISAVKLTQDQYKEFLKVYETYCMGMFWEFHPDGNVEEISYQGRNIKIKVKENE